jgi:inorganic pyrophosphatase
MAKRGGKRSNRRVELDRLETWSGRGDVIQVVIETPKGSRNKYAFDPKDALFRLKKVLPAGMAFPYDFGFVPSTLADDGDPIDVLVLMDDAIFPGCVIKCRLIGAILGQQRDAAKGKTVRNDRLVAVEESNHGYAFLRKISELGGTFLEELEEFFVNYHRLSKEKFRILNVVGPAKARKLVRAAER